MAEKSFAEMTLDEVFDLEVKHPAHLGRSVVTKAGLKRNAQALSQTIAGLVREHKRRRHRTARAR